jgi:hypothetical protein
VYKHDLLNVDGLGDRTYYVCAHRGIRGEYVNGIVRGGRVNYDMSDPDSLDMITGGKELNDNDFELCCIVQDYIKSTGKWDSRNDIEIA